MQEISRTYKLYVVPGLFLFFGFTSPLLTKLMPQLLTSLVGEISITLPEMTWIDSYGQFFKNLNQLGLLAVVLTTMGTIADERSRGISQLVLTKPVSRSGYVLAKYVANLLLVATSSCIAFGAAWLYTNVLFSGTGFEAGFRGIVTYLVYMAVILGVVIFASASTKSAVAAGGLTVLGLIVLNVLPFLSNTLSRYSPGALPGHLTRAIAGSAVPELGGAAIFAAATIVLLLVAASWVFSRKEL